MGRGDGSGAAMRRPLKPLSHNRCTRPAARARKANDWAPRYVGRGCGCCRFADGGEVRMGPSDTCRAGRPPSADATSVSAIAMRPSMVAMRRFSRAAARGAASASADAALLSAAHGRQAAYRKQPAASRRQRRAAAASVSRAARTTSQMMPSTGAESLLDACLLYTSDAADE